MPKASPVIEQKTKLAEGTVMLSLTLGQVSNRKKVDSDTVQSDIDSEMLHVAVELYDSKELKKCQNFLARLRLEVRAKSVPSFFRGGIFLVKHEALEIVDDILVKAQESFEPLVQAFADVADERRDEAKERLGAAYSVVNYPTPEQIKVLYSIKWNWFTMDTPDSLKKISKKIYKREIEKAETTAQGAADNINKLLAMEAKQLSDHLIERLTVNGDGNVKTFKRNSVDNITKYLATFRLRDIGTTEELQVEVKRMERLLEGISPEDLRNSASLREDISEGFKKVTAALDDIIVDQPNRFINLKEVHG